MRVRVLGCSGAIAQGCRTTSFLLDDNVLIDAGTGVGDLTLDEMAAVDHVLLTHSHLDHVAALPLMLDAVAARRLASGAPPLQVHALPGTIAALKVHIFNNLIWPDFSSIPSVDTPLMRFVSITVGEVLQVGGKAVEVLPAVHTVPAVGFAAATASGHWVFSGDTGRNPAFWKRVNELTVALLVIETAFSDREHELARRSLHLAPSLLAQELEQIDSGHCYPIYITHTKPAETGLIMEEIQRFDEAPQKPASTRHDIRWLSAGQTFEL
ncbi:3',5'-cyclic-nucleotide phosphodiesterase [Hydrogenophaga laconesensis]|uniref:Ribonuclease BN (tRNA processing enzyme) n=1 Tax=Hydrogenophaga laconesensis TaxID=1805971 RepID=A0ABU1VCN7_9BURK|nr:3',5'-cyclic-nucleotide phosphodiesterase [Hydrogenophaga laconesensis]MDR7095229.1 ribonuclease BN (tRNA processing enzyme) [Hydrogenophaga laconesensis]